MNGSWTGLIALACLLSLSWSNAGAQVGPVEAEDYQKYAIYERTRRGRGPLAASDDAAAGAEAGGADRADRQYAAGARRRSSGTSRPCCSSGFPSINWSCGIWPGRPTRSACSRGRRISPIPSST